MFLECKPYSWCALCCEWKLLIVEQFKWAYNPIRCNMTHQGRRNEFLKEVTRIAEIPPFAISVSDSSFHLMECYSFSSGWRSQKRFYFLVEWIFLTTFGFAGVVCMITLAAFQFLGFARDCRCQLNPYLLIYGSIPISAGETAVGNLILLFSNGLIHN